MSAYGWVVAILVLGLIGVFACAVFLTLRAAGVL